MEKVMSIELFEAHIAFIYPPHAPSTHPWSWATTSEIAVDAKHLSFNLIQLINGASSKEEWEDAPPDVAESSSVNN